MATYSKTLEDYFRIPVLVKPLTAVTPQSHKKLKQSLHHKYYSLPIDEHYHLTQSTQQTQILKNRQQCVQKIYFTPEDFPNDWPQFEIIYKIRYAIGIIDEGCDQQQIQNILAKNKNQNGVKLIGVVDMGTSTFQALIKKENVIKYPDISDSEFRQFIEPWLYNCLSIIEADICNSISQVRKEDESNRTIVFNLQDKEKFDPKVSKKRKKFRCIKLCGDYHLMLQLYRQALAFYNQAEEQLRKYDDFLWVLGSLQGKLACAVNSQSLSFSNEEEYIDNLINQTFSIAKKVKPNSFQVQNYFKTVRLYIGQPQKFQQMIKTFLNNYCKSMQDDQKFLLFTVLGGLYEKAGLKRKCSLYYLQAALIHLEKKPQLSQILLLQIQKSQILKQWPYLYKSILQMIISGSCQINKTSQYYLELLSKCGNDLTEKEIQTTLAHLNFSHYPLLSLSQIDFLVLKQFSVCQSPVKPKLNRIGKRQSKKKSGPGFFMSWKKQQNHLFQEDEGIIFRGAIMNTILFPIRLKISFEVVSTSDQEQILATPQILVYLQPNNLHKFQSTIRIKGASEQIWSIQHVTLSVWNFKAKLTLPHPIKLEIYEKQPAIDLQVDPQIHCEESSNLYLEGSLIASNRHLPFCLVKLSASVYYSVDVGFQENEVIMSGQNQFRGVDFSKNNNLVIREGKKQEMGVECIEGVLYITLKRLKVHRKYISRLQFILEYIRSPTTKYQTSKHYVSKCFFHTSLACEVESISTPMISSLYPQISQKMTQKLIEKLFTVSLKFNKTGINSNSTAYKITHDDKEYEFGNKNSFSFSFDRQKITAKSELKGGELKQTIQWQNMFNKRQHGQLQIAVPYHHLMKKCQRELKIQIKDISTADSKRKTIQYEIESDVNTNLSHQITLHPQEIEIDRMYALSGKSKLHSQGKDKVKNKLTVLFSSKCKNKYKMCISFADGWIYWHGQLLAP